MKKIQFLLLLLLLTISPRSYASHLYGGELLYQHISGNTYRVMLILYGDCASLSEGLFDSLMYAKPEVYVFDGQSPPLAILNLPIDSAQSDIEVTPVCPDEAHNTRCKSKTATLPGIKRFIYQQTITLSHTSANWNFVFSGLLYTEPYPPYRNIGSGRTNSITNLVFGQGSPQIMYLAATLNNLNGPNSSPEYTTVPTPFYCINVAQQYNQGATDPNGDSLAFSLIPGLTNGNNIQYQYPYSGAYPMATDSFSFNPLNGQMYFIPDLIQKALVVNQVREYKNGVLVGSSMREMTFIVLDNCQNLPPDGNLASTGSNIIGGIHDGNNVINACPGTPQISFSLSPLDPNNTDSVLLFTHNVPTGATVAINNNNTPNPVVNFNWNTASVAPGIYTFYINYKDNGCPLSANQTIAYTIQIANPYTITADILSETQCHHRASVRYNITDGVKPRTITVMQGSTVIKTLTDTSGTVYDSLAAGNYTIRVSSPYFPCDTSIDITIPDSGTYPISPVSKTVTSLCIGAEPVALPVSGQSLQWYDANGNSIPGPPSYATGMVNTYTWYASQQVGNCVSDTYAVQVRIDPQPEIQILNKAGKVCYADKIYMQPTGAKSYLWEPPLSRDADGQEFAFVTVPVSYTVIGIDTNGCRDTIGIAYTEIEQCCQFGYPNAFTPNGDGRNDRFRPVLYGNMEEYEISIYNRFGERVYQSNDPKSGWDGIYKGELCDVGMYYFRVKAKCYTGQTEEHADAVDLLR
jgi:gliding motility-associated-like protein